MAYRQSGWRLSTSAGALLGIAALVAVWYVEAQQRIEAQEEIQQHLTQQLTSYQAMGSATEEVLENEISSQLQTLNAIVGDPPKAKYRPLPVFLTTLHQHIDKAEAQHVGAVEDKSALYRQLLGELRLASAMFLAEHKETFGMKDVDVAAFQSSLFPAELVPEAMPPQVFGKGQEHSAFQQHELSLRLALLKHNLTDNFCGLVGGRMIGCFFRMVNAYPIDLGSKAGDPVEILFVLDLSTVDQGYPGLQVEVNHIRVSSDTYGVVRYKGYRRSDGKLLLSYHMINSVTGDLNTQEYRFDWLYKQASNKRS